MGEERPGYVWYEYGREQIVAALRRKAESNSSIRENLAFCIEMFDEVLAEATDSPPDERTAADVSSAYAARLRDRSLSDKRVDELQRYALGALDMGIALDCISHKCLPPPWEAEIDVCDSPAENHDSDPNHSYPFRHYVVDNGAVQIGRAAIKAEGLKSILFALADRDGVSLEFVLRAYDGDFSLAGREIRKLKKRIDEETPYSLSPFFDSGIGGCAIIGGYELVPREAP